jgi:hypothetical protein
VTHCHAARRPAAAPRTIPISEAAVVNNMAPHLTHVEERESLLIESRPSRRIARSAVDVQRLEFAVGAEAAEVATCLCGLPGLMRGRLKIATAVRQPRAGS